MEGRSAYAERHNSNKFPKLKGKVNFLKLPINKANKFLKILLMLLEKFKKLLKSRILRGGRKVSTAVF